MWKIVYMKAAVFDVVKSIFCRVDPNVLLSCIQNAITFELNLFTGLSLLFIMKHCLVVLFGLGLELGRSFFNKLPLDIMQSFFVKLC